MGRNTFISLPTNDLAAADTFYAALGFEKNPGFSNEQATARFITPQVWLMSLTAGFYETFLRGGDTASFGHGTKESLLGFSCDSREEVDRLTAAAVENGGAIYREPAEEMPGMYGSAVTDPDGHVWELMWMEQAG
ncbi:VOC family protein [Arthrobacter rhombi]|uniref:VOC family protein n=1 Tax=Arthrobacter rhombi TaxID=71253 RepID=UPI0031D5C11B